MPCPRKTRKKWCCCLGELIRSQPWRCATSTSMALARPSRILTPGWSIFASRLMNRKPPLVFEDGLQLRDFVNVRDIVQANLLAIESADADGIPLNIGSGQPISIREIAAELAQMLGADVSCQITGKYRAGDIRHCFADISRATRVLGYRPQVDFRDGLAELVSWLGSQQAEDRVDDAIERLEVLGLVA